MRRNLAIDQEIWTLSKRQFLQFEAQYWTFGTKTLEVVFVISVVAFWALLYLGQSQRLIIGAALVAVAVAISISSRRSKFEGFFDGYEQGFKDAGSNTLDYRDWDEFQNSSSEYQALESILTNMGRLEDVMPEGDKAFREEEIRRGKAKAAGFFPGL